MPISSESLYLRFRRIILLKMETAYLNARNRDQFIKVMQFPLGQFLNCAKDDCYLSELIEIFSVGEQLHEPESLLLIKAEKCREKWWSQEREGTLFSQPYIPVDELVHKTNPRHVVKFIVRFKTAVFFLSLLLRLEKARKRGGLREREEMKILSEANTSDIAPVTSFIPEIGFKWVGVASNLRITLLCKLLRDGGFIDRETSFKQVEKIFSGEPVTERVIWLKSTKLLLYFTDRLMDNYLVKVPDEMEDYLLRNRDKEATQKADGLKHIVSSWQYARIGACFFSNKKNPITADKLKHQRNDLDNKMREPIGGELVKKIVKDILAIRESHNF